MKITSENIDGLLKDVIDEDKLNRQRELGFEIERAEDDALRRYLHTENCKRLKIYLSTKWSEDDIKWLVSTYRDRGFENVKYSLFKNCGLGSHDRFPAGMMHVITIFIGEGRPYSVDDITIN